MSKWLAKFSGENQEIQPDIPDTLPKNGSVSGLSVPFSTSEGENGPTEHPVIPVPPLQYGWLVVYRDRQGALCGGADDRDHGTVDRCEWNGNGWRVFLTDGQQLGLSIIRAVGQTDASGTLRAAWTVREHGFDGEGAERQREGL